MIATSGRGRLDRVRRLLAAIGAALAMLASPLDAQGITSAAIQGRVTGVDQEPISGAIVRVTSVASGTFWEVVTDVDGRYFVENVEIGGPYTIEARRIGFSPTRRAGVRLSLGQRHRAELVLERMVVSLPDVVVADVTGSLLEAHRSGPEYRAREADLARMPNLARDINAAAALAPFAVARPLGGISVAGQNQGYNSLQIDGGVNADLYLGRSPGGASPSGALPEVLPRAISMEAVKEVQLLAAPFDVRMGSFAGGLLNAVTKSGTNQRQGSIFGFLQDGSLTGENSVGRRLDFTTWQLGGTVAGPIVRNRMHYFINADVQRRVVPDPGPLVTEPGRTGVNLASAVRFREILRDVYGLDAGTTSSDGRLPAQDLFAKATMQLGVRGRLELSHHYARAEREGFMDVGRSFDTTALSSVTGLSRSTAQTSRLIWSALWRQRAQSEVIVSYAKLHDSCRSRANFPLIQVAADSGVLIAGPNSVCPTTDVQQSALEITTNATAGVGAHLVTVGTQLQLLGFRDPLVQVSAGRWDFRNLDSLEKGVASHYDRGLPAPPPRGPGADFRVLGLGVYLQDRWDADERLSVTAGLRIDASYYPDEAVTNPDLLDRGIDTGRLPASAPQWSPRLGFSYDVAGDGRAFLRGGIGLFSGPPPYRWLGNAYRDSGDEMVVSCDDRDRTVPAFTPHDQPESCAGSAGTSRRISYFDQGFRPPQNLKVATGLDAGLPLGILASVDLLYTRAMNQILVTQANLLPLRTAASGEGGRPLYGRFDAGSRRLVPDWADTSAQAKEIYRLSNGSGDNAVSVSTQARKQVGDVLLLNASYTWSRVRDRMSIVNFPARANFSNTPLDGTIDHRRLRSSFFETPHKILLAATLGAPHRTHLTLIYTAASQPPFTYVVNGDANGDGIGGSGSLKNDIVYVPNDSADIDLLVPADYPRLDAFIEKHRCLREQRGRILERGSCRNAWLALLNARLATTIPAVGRDGRLELIADIHNLPNLLYGRWGRQDDITTGPSVSLLTLDGWDPILSRGRYRVPQRLPARGIVDDAGSRWRMQLGVKYHFGDERR